MSKRKRQNAQTRSIRIKRGYLKYADGSALVEFGDTKVICSASIEEGVPRFLRGSGQGWITAEYAMLPRSCKERIQRDSSKGRPSGRTHEIQRLIGRALRMAVDLKDLGERTIVIDCDVLQGDGGTRTASVTGGFVALVEALIKLKKMHLIDKIPLKYFIGAVSVGIVGGVPMLDLDYQEDSQADVDMNFVMTDKGALIEVQGTAEREPFAACDMEKLIKIAKRGINEINRIQRKALRMP